MSAQLFIRLIALAAISGISAQASAQYSVTLLHPPGSIASRASAMNNGPFQAGTVDVTPGGVSHASVWNLTTASWIDLNPAGALFSEAYAAYGNIQGGSAVVDGVQQASIWNGTAASWTSLHPSGATSSQVLGIHGPRQVGWTRVAGVQRAALWSGSAASRVDLNPAGSTRSIAYGATITQQAGAAQIGGVLRAGMWTGTAASWVNLHPAAGAVFSEAYGISQDFGGSYQFGYARVGDNNHASIWRGSSASWVDINPDGATSSIINATNGGIMVGEVDSRASLWIGTDDMFPFDLHSALPAEFSTSSATGFYFDGAYEYISGYGFNTTTNNFEALLWTQPVPAPTSAALLGLGGLLAARRRR
jgi:hypothetical protein